jgi:small RNA 2'-O-methyltransferase
VSLLITLTNSFICEKNDVRIEHLRPAALAAFAPVLLGLYSPRLFLVTTPSYTFNARFHAPGAPRPGGFADPTGRTERIFRHHDHQFEWTPAEFGAWCHTAADLWGYELAHFGGVGTPREADPYGRDDELGCATQVALFRRREGDAAAASRYVEYDRWLHAQQLLQQQQTDGSAALRSTTAAHELLATHRYESHPLSRAPLAVAEIGKLVEEKMCRFHAPEIAIHDLWNTSPVSSACGGWLELLIAGVNEREGLQLHPTEGRPRSEWLVTCAHATPPPPIDQDDAESTIRSSDIEIDSEDEYEIEYRKEGENDAVALNSWERYALPSDLQDSDGGWGVETGSNGWGAEAQGRGWGSSDYDVAGSWSWSTLQEKQHPTTQ